MYVFTLMGKKSGTNIESFQRVLYCDFDAVSFDETSFLEALRGKCFMAH